MESSAEALTELTERSQLPARAEATEIAEPSAIDQWDDRNPVFLRLVTGDDDIIGLVAYSIYKQNKLDWLLAFEKIHGRPPEEGELNAYILGESTPRRLATYRHLADSTLKGVGPGAKPSAPPLFAASASVGAGAGAGSTISYLILAVVVVIAIFLAARFGVMAK